MLGARGIAVCCSVDRSCLWGLEAPEREPK